MKVCQYYISIDQPECGDEGVASVTTKSGPVTLCVKHKAIWDETHARRRVARKAG